MKVSLEDRQLEEWADIFNILSDCRKKNLPEIDMWSVLSKKYVLVERVDLEELVK